MQLYCLLVDLLWNILPLHTWNFAWFNFTYVFMHTNIPQTCKKSWNGSVKMLFKHITVFQHKFSLTMLATIASVEVSIVNVDNIVSIGSMPQSLFILLSRICSVHVKFSVHELAVQDRILYPFNLKGAADKNFRISSNNYHRPTVILISVTRYMHYFKLKSWKKGTHNNLVSWKMCAQCSVLGLHFTNVTL